MSKNVGRPRIEINRDLFEKLCTLHAPLKEVAEFFECSEDTIERFCQREYEENFAEVLRRFQIKGNIALRGYQFALAKRSPSMAAFLGRNWLGQHSERQNLENGRGTDDGDDENKGDRKE